MQDVGIGLTTGYADRGLSLWGLKPYKNRPFCQFRSQNVKTNDMYSKTTKSNIGLVVFFIYY